MTKSEVKIIISHLAPLGVAYIGTILEDPYIIIAGSSAVLIRAIISAITYHKGEKIERNKTDNINNTSYTFYHK